MSDVKDCKKQKKYCTYLCFIMWWGFSEALDLLDEVPDSSNSSSEPESKENVYNVLLIGQFDCRHVLKTLAQKYRHDLSISLNFYIYEPLLENVARQLLFLTLALEPPDRLGIVEKTLFFMELYGNVLLRPATKKYLTRVSKCLLNVVTNTNYNKKILPSIYLDNLKYKERDQLEVIFKYWASNENSFDIVTAWNERIRKDLGVRYDSRFGVYDWDYHMRYHCFGAEVLKSQEYQRFRERGMSYYFEDTDPCMPNNTLASAIFPSGSKILSYGYLGDITTGPYPAFGFHCEDEEMFKKVNGQLPKTATDVTERNLMRIFFELQNQKPFVPSSDNSDHCIPVVYLDTSHKLKLISDLPESMDSNRIRIKDAWEEYNSIDTNNCNIKFLPTTALKDYPQKLDYENFFDVVFICQTTVLKYLKPEMIKMFKSNCRILIDTPKYLLNYRKESLHEFKNNLKTLMDGCQCKIIGTYEPEKDEFVRYRVKK